MKEKYQYDDPWEEGYIHSTHRVCDICGNLNKDCMCGGDNMSEE